MNEISVLTKTQAPHTKSTLFFSQILSWLTFSKFSGALLGIVIISQKQEIRAQHVRQSQVHVVPLDSMTWIRATKIHFGLLDVRFHSGYQPKKFLMKTERHRLSIHQTDQSGYIISCLRKIWAIFSSAPHVYRWKLSDEWAVHVIAVVVIYQLLLQIASLELLAGSISNITQ